MNGKLHIRPADDAASRKRFIDLPWRLYRANPCWVPPLRSALARVLAGRTAFFDHGEMALLLAEREGTPVGRIAAIHNKAHVARHNDGVGFFGFFECEEGDAEAARALVDGACEWLRARGLSAVRGPASPSMNAECGILIDGFDSPPMALMPYNPPAYAGLLESAGLAKCKDLYAYRVEEAGVGPGTPAYERLARLAAALARRSPEVSIRCMSMRSYPRDILPFLAIFEEARRDNWGAVPLTEREIIETAADMKRIIDPNLILLAEVDGRPAGAMLAIPNVSRGLAAAGGRMLPLGWLKFLLAMRRTHDMRIFGVAVLKQYRRKGITARLFLEEIIHGVARGYRMAEASWVLEDNQLSNESIRGAFNPRLYKTYRIYEKPLGPAA